MEYGEKRKVEVIGMKLRGERVKMKVKAYLDES